MSFGEPTLYEEGGQWVVRLEGQAGRFQLYHCATQAQAQRLCDLFRMPVAPRPRTAGGSAPTGGARPSGWSWFGSRTVPPSPPGSGSG